MLEKHASELYQLIAPIAGNNWNKIVLHGNVEPGSYQFDLYYRRETDAKFIKCYDEIPFVQMLPVLEKMNKICRQAQKELEQQMKENKMPQEMWTGFTFVLTTDGNFVVHYEYGNRPAGLSKEWHEAYLK